MGNNPTLKMFHFNWSESPRASRAIRIKLKPMGSILIFPGRRYNSLFLKTSSMMAMINRLKIQLPNISPMAMSGDLTVATAEIPVNNSGKEVTMAMKTTPINARANPLFSAIASAFLDALVPNI